MPKKQTPKPPSITSLLILAKHSDGKVRQVLADEQTQRLIVYAIVNNSPDKKITVNETPLDYLDWETQTDISKPLKNG